MFDKMLTKIRYAVALAALIALTGGAAYRQYGGTGAGNYKNT